MLSSHLFLFLFLLSFPTPQSRWQNTFLPELVLSFIFKFSTALESPKHSLCLLFRRTQAQKGKATDQTHCIAVSHSGVLTTSFKFPLVLRHTLTCRQYCSVGYNFLSTTIFYLPLAVAPTEQSGLLIFLIFRTCASPQGVLQIVTLVNTDKEGDQEGSLSTGPRVIPHWPHFPMAAE